MSFIENINALAEKLDVIIESNEIFDEGVIPVLDEIAKLDLAEAIEDLKKGNYLGNRKIDINLALNMEGITQDLIDDDPDAAEAIWIDPAKTVQYDHATITYTNGDVVGLPFIFDGNPTTISTHGDLLTQLNRLDYQYDVAQVDSIYQFTVADSEDYVVTIDNIDYTFTSGVGATRAEIIAGIANTINTAAIPITATVTANDNVELTADVAGNPFYAEVGSNMAIATVTENVIEGPVETEFLEKLESTLIAGFASDVVGEIVRLYDITGENSNVERIQLHAVSGNYKDQQPLYYWAKTTSAFETLSMRANDIIKLGNEIDRIILLANSIEEVIQVRDRIPELIDTYNEDGNPNGDNTIYNNLDELVEVYNHIQEILVVYNDIRENGTKYIETIGADFQTNDYTGAVGRDLQAVDSKITEVGNDIQNDNYVGTVGADLQDVDSKIKTVSDDLQDVDSAIKAVSDNLQTTATVDLVGSNIADVNIVAADIDNVNTVAVNIADVNTVADNIVDVQNAEANANTAIAKADEATAQAVIATDQATIATDQATIATTKANEIKGVTVGSTITGAAGSSAAVSYNSTSGKFSFVVPKGDKGDRGEAFQVNSVGLFASRSLYDTQIAGFSFLAIDQATIYFKMSNTSGDWSTGAPFGKGDKGDTGDTGNGILDITFDSTTDASGLAGKSGATDTYKVTYTDNTFSTFPVYNGIDSEVQTVAGRVGDVVLTEADITGLDKYTQAEVDGELALKATKIQTSTTDTQYTDATTATSYKLYIDNGEIIMEEL